MDISPVAIFNVIVGILIAIIAYVLYRRHQAADADGEIDIFTYGQLFLQAEQTARIIVRDVQEAWRTGELEDDEREVDAIEKLVELYPMLSEDDLRSAVKSAVYLLRQSAGKQLDRVMEKIPQPRIEVDGSGALTLPPILTRENSTPGAGAMHTQGITPEHLRGTTGGNS